MKEISAFKADSRIFKDHFPDCLCNAVGINSAFSGKFFLSSMLNEIIGYSQAFYFGPVSVIAHKLNNCASKSTFEYTILNSDYFVEFMKTEWSTSASSGEAKRIS